MRSKEPLLDIVSGTIEIIAEEINILSKASTPPFMVSENQQKNGFDC